MTPRVLAVERLSPEDLQALDAVRLVAALHEVMSEAASLGRHALGARTKLGAARKALILADKRDAGAYAEARCDVIDAQTLFDVIRDRAKTLREVRSMLQSVLKAEKG